MALFVEERRRLIVDQLKQHGRVSVTDLSALTGVSAVTIRQDLRALEDEGALERTYGGAVRADASAGSLELSFHVRQHKKRLHKEAIAAAAVASVQDGFSVALDSSTTAFVLAPLLTRFNKLTVVTNSLMVAEQFLRSPHINVLMPGGRVRRDSASIVGRPDELPDVNLNIGFFGTRGISLQGGVTDVDIDESALKQALVQRCVETVIVADGSKWGQVAPYTFARFHDVHRLITTDDAPAELVRAVSDLGPTVEIVHPARR